MFEIFVDGASRGNPGQAGIGIFCRKNQATFFKHGFFVGYGTNNFAEYCALICGLFILKQKTALLVQPRVNIFSDSQLLVYQINGLYKTKNAAIKIFIGKARALLMHFSWSAIHIRREKNSVADELANLGIDKQIALPPELKQLIALTPESS
jgi:ribonuclease HI